MAQQYVLSTDSFVAITETNGTIQNAGIEAVELVSGTNAVAGEGITLRPGERIAFDGAISARRLGDNDAIINVVDFSLTGKGGVNRVYIPKGSVAFANLPTTLTEDMLGWTYNVSDAFTTDSQFVDGAGISYPAGQNVVVVEASEGVYKYDCFAGAYILPVATETVLGGIKSSTVAGGVSVDSLGNPTINLPTASESVKGGIKLGDSFDIDNDVLILEPAKETVVGGIKSSTIDGGISVDTLGNATINLPIASDTVLGGVKSSTVIGGVKVDSVGGMTFNLGVADETLLGGVKSSSLDGGVSVNNDGTMSLNRLFYRKANTAYAVGDIVYHNALAVSQKLVCVKAGTSANSALTLSSTDEGAYITDGTVAWCIDSLADGNYSAGHGNGVYRGVDVTAYWESGDMSANIQAGKFVGMHIGDWITKSVTVDGMTYSNVKWILGDFDYHLHCGQNETTTHHVLVFPEDVLGKAYMNATNTTEDGYVGSEMWTTTIPLYVTGIQTAFGLNHVLSHEEFLSIVVNVNATSKGVPSNIGVANTWVWTSVIVNIFNEAMIYGNTPFSSSAFDVGDCNTQLAAMRHIKSLSFSRAGWYWLRTVTSAMRFATASYLGNSTDSNASNSNGCVRPYFLLY